MYSNKIKQECKKIVNIDPTLYTWLVVARRISCEKRIGDEFEGFFGDETEIANRLYAMRMALSRGEYDKAWEFVNEF